MACLGEIYFEDLYGNITFVYMYDALSMASLQTYALALSAYTAATTTGLIWCADGRIEYENRQFVEIFNVAEERQAVSFSGAVGSALTCREKATFFMMSQTPRGRRATSIPAPLHNILSGCHLLPAIGQTMTALFAALTGKTLTYQSGRIITPEVRYTPQTNITADGKHQASGVVTAL